MWHLHVQYRVEYVSHQPGASPCTVHCTVHKSGVLQKHSHWPLMSPVPYMSLERFTEALPSVRNVPCTVHLPKIVRKCQ